MVVAVAAAAVIAMALGGEALSESAYPRCFGAASRDARSPCINHALDRMVIPTPAVARTMGPPPCKPVADDEALDVCAFGTDSADPAATIALLGDSHAEFWWHAVDPMARAERWAGYTLVLGGCPYSTATRVLSEPLLSQCIARNDAVPGWFDRHPEVHTVFVAQISGVEWLIPPDQDQFEGQVEHYIEAWSRLPDSVTHIVVIRDTPKAERHTRACIRRAISKHQNAGLVCRVPRRRALTTDPAVVAARRLASKRVQVINLTRFFCDGHWCYPVIGGALVQKDVNHLTPTFIATLSPYLQESVDALAAAWTG
ncbi:MAG: SGNH hydrolase domain-containing protein [Thermoleophilaceae bacterium]